MPDGASDEVVEHGDFPLVIVARAGFFDVGLYEIAVGGDVARAYVKPFEDFDEISESGFKGFDIDIV